VVPLPCPGRARVQHDHLHAHHTLVCRAWYPGQYSHVPAHATRLLRAGTNVRVVQQLMRHESLDSTMRYTAVDEVELLDGIGRLPH
jgi:integrase